MSEKKPTIDANNRKLGDEEVKRYFEKDVYPDSPKKNPAAPPPSLPNDENEKSGWEETAPQETLIKMWDCGCRLDRDPSVTEGELLSECGRDDCVRI